MNPICSLTLQTIILLVKNASNLNDFQFVSDVIIGPIGGSLISLIPSGMYLLFSTTLLTGVGVLAKKRVLVHDMYSLDTLARVDTLCIDKTGTITDGTMLVDKIELFDEKIMKMLLEGIQHLDDIQIQVFLLN